MAKATHTLTPESVKPALADLDPVRREILRIFVHLPRTDQAALVKFAKALEGSE